VIIGCAFSNLAQPPASAVSGEFWMVHATGSYFRLANDGSVRINGNLTVTGNVVATGDVSDQNGTHGTLATLRTDYNQHTHLDSSGGRTSPPTPQD
jgi:hypothetical protein